VELDHETPTILYVGAVAVALPTISRIALALDYPTRLVRWIVGFPFARA
jgi:hypothetical protein